MNICAGKCIYVVKCSFRNECLIWIMRAISTIPQIRVWIFCKLFKSILKLLYLPIGIHLCKVVWQWRLISSPSQRKVCVSFSILPLCLAFILTWNIFENTIISDYIKNRKFYNRFVVARCIGMLMLCQCQSYIVFSSIYFSTWYNDQTFLLKAIPIYKPVWGWVLKSCLNVSKEIFFLFLLNSAPWSFWNSPQI